jgi:hypothetical protein
MTASASTKPFFDEWPIQWLFNTISGKPYFGLALEAGFRTDSGRSRVTSVGALSALLRRSLHRRLLTALDPKQKSLAIQ